MIRSGRHIFMPAIMQVRVRAPQAAAAVSWWLSGGISGANCVAAYQPKGAASQAASYVNLANPGTYDAAPGVAPTWASGTGWTFNGSNQYLITSVYFASGWSWAVRYSFTSGYDVFGSNDGGSRIASLGPNITNVSYWNLGGVKTGGGLNTGVAIATNATGYFNGASFVTSIPAWSGGASTRDIYIGCRNQSTIYYTNCTIIALAIYNTNISAYVTALNTAMAAL